jgi:hypothetical protein
MSLNNLLSQNSGVKHIPTYQSYRREILEAAAVHKLRVHSIEFDKGPDGQPIFSDIISTAINPDKPTYVQLAGCHGVEGYLGCTHSA